jgi:sulfite reductase (NADPH) flavoprotein alpha-component
LGFQLVLGLVTASAPFPSNKTKTIMTNIPFIPETAPFTPEQRQWLNGFLAGMFSSSPSAAGSNAAPKEPLLLLYGSQTGTAEGLAKKTAKQAEKEGFAPKVVCMEKFTDVAWEKESNVLVLTSTYGDGEPPDNAQAFWNWLASDHAPRLEHLNYGVLALGDKNYPAFCEFGKKCDARFESLGARRAVERRDCDVEYEEPAAEWTAAVLAKLRGGNTPVTIQSVGAEKSGEIETDYSRKNPYPAKLKTNQILSGAGSQKEVRHFEFLLGDSGLHYEAGDALGVFPKNSPVVVDSLLAAMACDGEEAVTLSGVEIPLRLALSSQLDVTKPSTELIDFVAERSAEFAEIHADKNSLKSWLYGREVIDLLALIPGGLKPSEFIALLRKLAPRLYSISSSPKLHPGEVHLTVGIVRYQSHGLSRGGVCSTFLADRANEVPVFIQPSHGFKVPASGDTPMIMVGPGTGIAPFRAFVEERIATGAEGRNWLFFGEQRRNTDFLYEDTLSGWVRDGHLSRLDLAFSRDQAEKIYVQNRMIEQSAELWRWLEEGAHFYVCGDASRMAKDVDAALHKIIETSGGKTSEEAAAYVARLKSEKRYQRDVY